MKLVNDKLKNALKRPTTQRKGRIFVNGKYYDVYNVQYSSDCYDEGKVIGNAIASQLTFDIPVIEKFDKFTYFDGVWTGTKYEYVDMGKFIVFDADNNDDFSKHIVSFDSLIKFNAPFIDKKDYPKTLFAELQNICEQAGVELLNETIPNANFVIENNQFVNDESLKTVLKEISRISGNFATIKNDKVFLQLKNITSEKIDKSQHEPIIWKRKTYGINQVVLGMKDVEGEYVVREDKEDIAKNGVHKLVINDSPFAYTQAKRNELIDAIFNQVKGFGYIPYEARGEWLNYLEIGDTINIDGIDTIVLRINAKVPNALDSTTSAPAIIDNSLDYIDNTNSIKNQIKRTEIIVDKQNQKIETLSKKIADVAKDAKGVGRLVLEDCAETFLYKLVIKNACQTFPSAKLFPSKNLFTKSSKVIVEHAGIKTFYELPPFCLRNVDNTYDELVIENAKVVEIKRIGVRNDGTLYILPTPIKIEFEDISIQLKEGRNFIYLESFDDPILEAKYLLKNDYTDIFGSKMEVESKISVAVDEITLQTDLKLDGVNTELAKLNIKSDNISSEVSKKIGEDEVVSSINQSAEQITLKGNRVVIDSNNFKLSDDGTAQMKNAIIDGGNINLKNGANIIGGDGLISNLIYPGYVRGSMFNGSGDYLPLGHVGGGDTLRTQRNLMAFTFTLPKNFTIKSAKIYLTHAPINWSYEGKSNTGYSRNLNIYKILSTSIDIDLQTLYAPASNSFELIKGGFGASGFTGASSGLSNAESIDIKDSISLTGNNQLAVMTSDGFVSTNDDIFGQTGGVVGYLEIIGFTNFN